MTVDLRYLLDFLDLARTGNFSATARNRSISQPALTRRIQRLEEWVGRLLFDRSATPLQLTSAGQEFCPVAARLVDELESFRKRATQDDAAGPLRFMSIHSLGTVFLPSWLSGGAGVRLQRAPAISFGTYDQCFAALRENEIDIALVYHTDRVREARFKGLCRKQIGVETFVPVVAADYARKIDGWQKAGAPPPAVVELSRDNYLGQALASAFDHCRRQLGYAAGPVAVRIDAVKGLVEAGCGIGWLPQSMVRSELSGGFLRLAESRTPSIRLDVVLIAASAAKLEFVSELRAAREATIARPHAEVVPQRH